MGELRQALYNNSLDDVKEAVRYNLYLQERGVQDGDYDALIKKSSEWVRGAIKKHNAEWSDNVCEADIRPMVLKEKMTARRAHSMIALLMRSGYVPSAPDEEFLNGLLSQNPRGWL